MRLKSVLFFAAILFLQQGKAQLFKFTFDGSATNPTQGNAVSIQNGTVTPVTRSSGLNWITGDEVFNSSGWNLSTQGSQCVLLTITANPGYVIRIQSVGVSSWSTFTGPSNARLSIEKNNAEASGLSFTPGKAASSGASAPSSLPSTFHDISASLVASDRGGSLTIKIYGWGNASGGNMRIDNFYVNGTILPDGPLSLDYINNRVGVDVSTTLTEKLEVNGKVKATGLILTTNPGANKILTSDASGNASWQTPGGSSPWLITGNDLYYSVGNIGIGTSSSPSEKLEVAGNIKANGLIIPGGTSGQVLTVGANGVAGWQNPTSGGSSLWNTSSANSNIYNNNTGFVAIGTLPAAYNGSSNEYKLYVEKGIRTRKLKVDPSTTPWPDYVFDNDYRLPSLKEVETFITENKHLPGITSSEEVKKEGIDVGENQALLLKKIEELTLYAIEQNKKAIDQGRELKDQQELINKLQKQIEELKKIVLQNK